MTLELDHLFICTAPQAPEAEALIQAGFTEGSGNAHPGQGTRNRRFFFQNLMLELLWVEQPEEAQSAVTAPTHLWERWAGRSGAACPFGVCLRPTDPASPPAMPFPSWAYRPAYLPQTLSIAIANNAHYLTEPLIFYIPFGRPPATFPPERAQPCTHALGVQTVTAATIALPPDATRSEALREIQGRGYIRLEEAPQYHLTLEFDGAQQGKQQSWMPQLPLTVRW